MPLNTLTFGGKEYTWDPQKDISLVNLRQIKAMFGAELANYKAFFSRYILGDPDALACVVWMARRRAGDANVPDPRRMPDFSVAALQDSIHTEGITPTSSRTWPKIVFHIDDVEYPFDPNEMLTLERLRYIKARFPELGGTVSLMSEFLAGDPDAAACVAWMVRTAAGEQGVEDPRYMEDFSVAEIIETLDALDIEPPDEVEEPPLPGPPTSEDPANPTQGEVGS